MKLVRSDLFSSNANLFSSINNDDDADILIRHESSVNLPFKRSVQLERTHPLLERNQDGMLETTIDSPWSAEHLPYTIVGTLLAAVALAAVLAYVIIKRRRKATSPLTPEPPKQPTMRCPSFTIRLTPSLQQPLSVLEITSQAPSQASTSPTTSRPLVIDSISASTTTGGGIVLGPVTAAGAIISQPIRIKAKGLLERRGSSASLTIDLNPVETLHLATPPKECSAVEYLTSAGNRLTRRQLRMCLKDSKSLHQEFLDIPLNHPGKLDLPGCSNKNRYKSIWPNEHSRVKLPKPRKLLTIAAANPPCTEPTDKIGQGQIVGGNNKTELVSLAGPIGSTVSPVTVGKPIPIGGSTSGRNTNEDEDLMATYINANYIRGYDNDPKTYIAAQGPLVNTIDDFWSMVWHERSPCIVMMTRLKENNRVKCEPYLPTREAQYGQIHVTVRMTTAKNGYYVRDLILRRDNEFRPIKHYWFTGWPDHKAPASVAKQLIELVQEVEAERQKQLKKRSKDNVGAQQQPISPSLTGPVVVHCSAGLGRTGCFIATSVGMKQLREENMADVLGIVCQLRLDRGGMIQTVEQYEFIHYALMQYERQLPETPTSAPLPLTSSGSHSNSNNSSRGSSKHDSPVF